MNGREKIKDGSRQYYNIIINLVKINARYAPVPYSVSTQYLKMSNKTRNTAGFTNNIYPFLIYRFASAAYPASLSNVFFTGFFTSRKISRGSESQKNNKRINPLLLYNVYKDQH